MPHRESTDASFFSLVHNVLQAEKEETPDRRGGDRHKYLCPQFIAPYRDGRLPAGHEFRRVLCYDLSSSGFSYLADVPPDCEHLVVALGRQPFMFVSAQVMHHSAKQGEHGGQVLVGCRFLARIKDHQIGSLSDTR